MSRALRPRNPNVQYAIPTHEDEPKAAQLALPTPKTLKRKRQHDDEFAYEDVEELQGSPCKKDVQRKSRKPQSNEGAETELSAAEIKKRAFIARHELQYLTELPRSEWIYADGSLPTSYVRLKLGQPGNVLDVTWDQCQISYAEAWTAEFRFKNGLYSIAFGRKAQACTLERQYPYPFSVKACRLLVDLEIWSFVDIVRAGMKYRTQMILGQARIKYEYIESMEGFTRQDLLSWFVYYGIIVEPDKTISEHYVGSSHDSQGGCERLFGYDKAIEYGCRGFVSRRLLEPFPTAALKAIQRGGQVFVRPLYVFPGGIPTAGPEQDAARDVLRLVEGVFCDHRRCIRDEYIPHVMNGEVVGTLNDSEIVKYSWSLTPSYLEDRTPGLNKVSPFIQGHMHDLPGESEMDKAIKRQPGGAKCLMCADQANAWDMTKQRNNDGTRACRCTLFGKLAWATQEWICPPCSRWIIRHEVSEDGSKSIKDLGIQSLEDLREAKRAGLQHNMPRSVEDGETCPLCDVLIVSASLREGQPAKKCKLSHQYAALLGVPFCCRTCSTRVSSPGNATTKKKLHLILSRANITMARELFKAPGGTNAWIEKYQHLLDEQ